ncbi:MAG: quaternary ammonium transporter [Acaryochloridaceae cyanobacterium SU_2_1]|nr:quaternary ammonium transporter [Acaryochloridaceae cyanobacterium SU_2_1]
MKSYLSRWVVLVAIALLTVLSIIACQGGSGTQPKANVIRIGSKDFTEQFILGEMYASLLEDRGLPVSRKLNLGDTPVAQAALLQGDIDLYPEYTGAALLTVLKQPTHKDPKQVYKIVSRAYKAQYNLIWLNSAPMNSAQVLVMKTATARAFGIQNIDDFVRQANQLRIVGPPEFTVHPDGLPGLKKVYGAFQPKAFMATEPGLQYKALESGQAEVAVGFGTDGEIDALNLMVIKDNRGLFPTCQVAPVVRQPVLETYTELKKTLNSLAPYLTDSAMRRLNYHVSAQQQEPRQVAQTFLRQAGLLRSST